MNRDGMSNASISDKDIINCNSRLYAPYNMAESSYLWAIGKQIGLYCRGDEEEVVKEYDSMEVRDSEVMNNRKEGKVNGVL